MKSRKIIMALALALSLGACENQPADQSKISDQTIEDALSKEENLEEANEPVEEEKEASSQEEDKEDSSQEEEVDETLANLDLDYEKIQDYLVEIGEFDPAILDYLSKEDLADYYLKAQKASQETGYWDVKDFIFQEIAKAYPDLSYKFPLDSVEAKYSWPASENKLTDKYSYERKLLTDMGYVREEIDKVDDKSLEESFDKAYEENPKGLYNDYIKMVGLDLFGEVKEPESKEEDLIKFGQSQQDYDRFKKELVEIYEFDQAVVDTIPNKDIDLANTRAHAKLAETGFGDIGLVINELAKMYPGSSTMYPGK
ncbi:MAG: hypothetical protein Q4D88_01105 [Anaerococcus sp.]|nr:hypothetical protein [Anaerococcus sp.]